MDKADRPTDNSIDVEQHSDSTSTSKWAWFGQKLPRSEIVFFVQVIVVYIVIIVSIVNLTIGSESDKLWISLLSSSIGYILPSPNLKVNKP